MFTDDRSFILNHKPICSGCIQYRQSQDLERKTWISRPTSFLRKLKVIKLVTTKFEELKKNAINSCNLKENLEMRPVENDSEVKTRTNWECCASAAVGSPSSKKFKLCLLKHGMGLHQAERAGNFRDKLSDFLLDELIGLRNYDRQEVEDKKTVLRSICLG